MESMTSDGFQTYGSLTLTSNYPPFWYILYLCQRNGKIIAVLDIDSEHYNTFDETDRIWLERIVKIISNL